MRKRILSFIGELVTKHPVSIVLVALILTTVCIIFTLTSIRLDADLDHLVSEKLEYHKKFSIPFACIALGILAVPLGIQSKSAKKSNALGLGLAFFLIYYLMLSAGRVFGETGVYPPVIGMWVPNIVLGALGLYLLIQTTNDRSINITRFSISLIKKS